METPDLFSDPDPAATHLGGLAQQVSRCHTMQARDELLQEIVPHVAEIVAARPDLERRWYAALDALNRRLLAKGRIAGR